MGFFEQFFGELSPNTSGEANVLCPFPHDKGYETHPSAHVNLEKRVFHCKTCAAEGRFNGLSEAAFVARLYNLPYRQAIKFLSQFDDVQIQDDVDNWEQATEMLLQNDEAVKYLASRGITVDMIKEYHLGYAGDGIIYPVTMNGVVLDRRTYNFKRNPGEPKIKSEKGASPALFPFDQWHKDTRDTLLCAGENDTLLARKMGFNAVTSTGGEGNFPEMFLGLFQGRKVYICYDCDEAGRKGARQVAFKLKETGAIVYIVDLGLPGTKDDKDITDFFIKHNKTAADLQDLLSQAKPYTQEDYQEQRDREYPLVDLWEINHGEYSGRRISSRVTMMGKYDMPMEAPVAVQWECTRPNEESPICQACRVKGKSGWWTLDDENLDDVLKLVEVTDQQQSQNLNQMIGVPKKCPGGFRKYYREKKHVQKVIFAPDAETEDELSGFRATEHYSYVIGTDLENGGRYRIYFRRYPHPKTQQIVSVCDRVEASDSAVNTFRMTPEIIQELSQFQGDPWSVMDQRYELARSIVGTFAPQPVVEAVNIMYHSVLDFRYAGKLMKGHPEILIIGPSRTGKTDTAKKLQQFFGLGSFTECKTATTAGLLGGADKLPSGGHRIRWGKIPRNHKRLLILDELSGMPSSVMSSLTALRSERIARIEKIVDGAAPAKTRLLWMSNPRVQSDGKSRNIALYPTGVDIVLDLIGSDEDTARFDAVIILPPVDHYISPFAPGLKRAEEIDSTPYRHLVYWAWSRTPDQVTFAPGVEEYIWQIAQELNEKYDSDVKFFGAEANKKLARIAVSVACLCFSHDGTGESIWVNKEHVDWARDFLTRCYDNDTFRLVDYVEQRKMTTTTNEEINNLFAAMVQGQAMLMKTLSRTTEINLFQLRTLCGMEQKEFDEAISKLVQHGMLETTKNGVMPTLRFRKARDAYVNNIEKIRLTPLSQKGGLPI